MHKRIVSWVQTKVNGRQEKKRFEAGSAPHHAVLDTCNEEFSDWPHGLLAIGTFGNNELKEDSQRHDDLECSHSLQEFPDFTLEEVNKLQKELVKLLALKPKSKASESETGVQANDNLPLDRFLNCPSSLEVDRMTCQKSSDDLDNGQAGDLSPHTKIILNRAKAILADNCNKLRQKSIPFLLKKMFVCRSGFAPAPSLRDPVSESRMEKFLKAILHKKIYPQNSAPTTLKKYLEKRPVDQMDFRDKMIMMMRDKEEKAEARCKWVKTDSEYIVLEM